MTRFAFHRDVVGASRTALWRPAIWFGALPGALIFPLGPAWPQQIRSDVRIGVVAVHDSNLLRTNRIRGGADQAEDTRITPTITLDLKHRRGRHNFYLKGDAGYDFYDRNKQLEAARVAMEGGGRFALGARCKADLTAALDVQQSDIAELGVVIRNRSQSLTYSGYLACPRPAGLYPELNASRTVTDNSSAARSIFDLRVLSAGGSLVYARPSLGQVALYYSYGLLERPGVLDPVTGQQDSSRIHRAGVRFDRYVAARLGASLVVGMVDVKPRRSTTPGFSSVDWLGEIKWQPTSLASLTARFQRQVRGESNFGASYVVADGIALESRWSLSPRTNLELQARHERRRLRGEEPTPGLPPRQSDKTVQVGAKLRYALTPSLQLGGEVAYSRRDAGDPFYDYHSTRAGLRADYRF